MKGKAKYYIVNSLLISLLLAICYSIQGFRPFGDKTMLTIDLSQQYVDYFQSYRHSLMQGGEGLLYDFHKALGGASVGLWAYYLLSPFNLIFLLFPADQMDLAVSLITYLKLLAAANTMLYFIRYHFPRQSYQQLSWSLSYALMSYNIVYLLNIMWLDGLVMLPLIAVGLDKVLKGQSALPYTLSLALMMIFNFYIAYMICLFLIFYAVYLMIDELATFKEGLRRYLRFAGYSLLATGLAALVLLPTLYSMVISKGSYFKTELDWQTVHSLGDVLSKLHIGAFDYEEIKAGSPNLYTGGFALIMASLYFFQTCIKRSKKVWALLILIVFGLAYRYELFDRIWHGGQLPIWYDYRFSFIQCFFSIILAAQSYQIYLDYGIKRWQFILVASSYGLFCLYYLQSDYDFQTASKLLFSLALVLAYLALLGQKKFKRTQQATLLLIILCLDLTINANLILNEFSYAQASKYQDYVKILNQAMNPYRPEEGEFYRIHKNFLRTKNDAMAADYSGLDHFSSSLEANTIELYAYLGLAEGNAFVTYSQATLFLDDFFGIRYFLDVADHGSAMTELHQYYLRQTATDFDQEAYDIINLAPRYVVRENQDYLPLAMEVSPDLVAEESVFYRHQPIRNQELLLSLLDFNGNGQAYFKEHEFTQVDYNHIEVVDKGDSGVYYNYQVTGSDDEEASLVYHFDTQSKNPYYFTLPSQYRGSKLSYQLNGQPYRVYSTFRSRQTADASFNRQESDQKFEIIFETDELKANLPRLYEFDYPRYQNMLASKQGQGLVIESVGRGQIKGQINNQLDQSYLLFSLPYDQGWQAEIDGKPVETVAVLNDTLLALPIQQGDQQVTLTYQPPGLKAGSWISLLSLIFLLILERRKRL